MDERKYVWHQCKELTRVLRHVFGYANNSNTSSMIEREEALHGVVMELRQIDRLPVELVPVIMFVANICDQIARDMSKDKNSSRPSVDVRDLRVCCYHLQVAPLAALLHGHYQLPLHQQPSAVSAIAMNMAAAALVPPLPAHHHHQQQQHALSSTTTNTLMNHRSSAIGAGLSEEVQPVAAGAPGLHQHHPNLNLNLTSQHSYGASNTSGGSTGAPANTNNVVNPLTMYGDHQQQQHHHHHHQMNMNMNHSHHQMNMNMNPHHHLHHLAAHQERQLFSQQSIHPHHSVHPHHHQQSQQQQSMYYPPQPLHQPPASLINTSASKSILQQSTPASTTSSTGTTTANTPSPAASLKANVAPEKKKLTPKSEPLPQSSTAKATPTNAATAKASGERPTAPSLKEELVTTTHRTGLGILQSLRSGTTLDKSLDPKNKAPLMSTATVGPTTTTTGSTEMTPNENKVVGDAGPVTVKTPATATSSRLTSLSKNDDMKSTLKGKVPVHEDQVLSPTIKTDQVVTATLKPTTTAPPNGNPKNNKREQHSRKPRAKKSSFKVKEDKSLTQDTPLQEEAQGKAKRTSQAPSSINFFSGQTLEENSSSVVGNIQPKEKVVMSTATTTTTSRKDKHATSALKALLNIQSSGSSSAPAPMEERVDIDASVFSQFDLKLIEQIEQQTETNIRSSSSSTNCYFLIRGYSMDFILTAKAILMQQQEDFQQSSMMTNRSSSSKQKEDGPVNKKENEKNTSSSSSSPTNLPTRKKQNPRSRRSSSTVATTATAATNTTGNSTDGSTVHLSSKQKYVRVNKNRPTEETKATQSSERFEGSSNNNNQLEHQRVDNHTTVEAGKEETISSRHVSSSFSSSQENNQEEHVEEDVKLRWAQEAELDERSSKVFTQLPYHDAKKIMESYQVKQASIKNPSAWFQKTCSNFKNRNVYHQSKLNPSSDKHRTSSETNPALVYDDLPPLEIMSPEMQPQDRESTESSVSNIWKVGDDAPPSSPSSGIGSHIHPTKSRSIESSHHPLGGSSSFSPWTVGKDWSFLSSRR